MTDELTSSEKFVLYVVQEADGELTTSDIIDRTTLHEQVVWQALRTLESAGLVDMRPNPTDARMLLIKDTSS
jgi:DNA-binding MarR family transcriptional regulator